MATIEAYETASGTRYRVRYRTPDRKQTDKRGFKTQRDAKAFAAQVEVDKKTGEFVRASSGEVTVGELGPVWMDSRVHLKRGSQLAYSASWRKHVEPRWGKVKLLSITQSAVQTWISELSKTLAATTIRHAYDILSGILESAANDRLIPRNPAKGVKMPRRIQRKHIYLTHEQVRALADASGERGVIIYVLAYTGLRWGELAGLHVGDVDLERGRITVERTASLQGGYIEVGTTKNHKTRYVPIPPFLADMLRMQIGERVNDSVLFPNKVGSYMFNPTRGNTSWFHTAKKVSGMPDGLVIHDLRHTYASLAVSAGANVKAVQHALGHASAALTLQTYAGLFPDDLDSVAISLDAARSQ